MENKKISVIIPNFNDNRVERSINSVISQSYTDIEIIVVEGCMQNTETKMIYQKYEKNILLVNEKDNGIFDALNKGISKATGNIIYLMGADDFLSNSLVFGKIMNYFEKNDNLNGVSIGCKFIKKDRVIREWYPNEISSQRMLLGYFPPHFSLFLKTELYNEVGLFDYKKTNNVATDILWMIDLAIKKPSINIIVDNELYLNMEYGGASTGSLKAVVNQFLVVFKYTYENKIWSWPFLSFNRTFSKIFQFKLF